MPQIPIHVTEIKKLILKDQISPDSSSLNEDQLLNVLTSNSCGRNPTFFKAFGHNEVFGLKSCIPEGGTVVEIVERVPVEGGTTSPEETLYRQEGVLYVHLPDGHPIITGSTPTATMVEPMQVTTTESAAASSGSLTCTDTAVTPTFMNEELNLDPLNMEAEVTIDDTYPEEMDQMQIAGEDPVLIVVDLENSSAKSSHDPNHHLQQPDIITLDDETASSSSSAAATTAASAAVAPAGLPEELGPQTRRHNLRPQRTNKHLHALKQQVKRRKKNTNVTAGIPLPQRTTSRRSTLTTGEIEIPFRPFPGELDKEPKSMKEVLGSIPGFNHRKLRINSKNANKKLSCAQMIQQTKEGGVNLESPESILGQVNLRTLVNKTTFAKLPPLYQFKLIQLLPQTDMIFDEARGLRINSSAFNNEFFAKACHEWRERLLRGDFTPEALQKNRSELESDRRKLDPWKAKHFEPIWGVKKVYDLNNTLPKIEDEPEEPVDRVKVELECDIEASDAAAANTAAAVASEQQTIEHVGVTAPIKVDVTEKVINSAARKTSSPLKSPRVKITEHFEEIKDLSEPLSKKRKLDLKEAGGAAPLSSSAAKRLVLPSEAASVPVEEPVAPPVKAQEADSDQHVEESQVVSEKNEDGDMKVEVEEIKAPVPTEISESKIEIPVTIVKIEVKEEEKVALTEPSKSVEEITKDEQKLPENGVPSQSPTPSAESERVLPKQIDSRQSSSDESAPLLISEDNFVGETLCRELSAPPTLSPNGSPHVARDAEESSCDLVGGQASSEDSATDDDKSDLTSESDSLGLVAGQVAGNLRQSLDSCESELEVINDKVVESNGDTGLEVAGPDTAKSPSPPPQFQSSLDNVQDSKTDNAVSQQADETLAKVSKSADDDEDLPDLNFTSSKSKISLSAPSISSMSTALSCLSTATTTVIITTTTATTTTTTSTTSTSVVSQNLHLPSTSIGDVAIDLNPFLSKSESSDLPVASSIVVSQTSNNSLPRSIILENNSTLNKQQEIIENAAILEQQMVEAEMSPPVLTLPDVPSHDDDTVTFSLDQPSPSLQLSSLNLPELTPSQPSRSLTLLETLLQQCRTPPRSEEPLLLDEQPQPPPLPNHESQTFPTNPIPLPTLDSPSTNKPGDATSLDSLLNQPQRSPTLLETLIKTLPSPPEKERNPSRFDEICKMTLAEKHAAENIGKVSFLSIKKLILKSN